jgi:hypothetical protein
MVVNANGVLSGERVPAICLGYEVIALPRTIGVGLTALALQESPLVATAAIWKNAHSILSLAPVDDLEFVSQLITVDSGRVCHSRSVRVTAGCSIIGGNVVSAPDPPLCVQVK